MVAKEISLLSSATYKWGVLVLKSKPTGGTEWSTVGFFKTEKAAKRWAVALGVDLVLIARRFDSRELRGSRGAA